MTRRFIQWCAEPIHPATGAWIAVLYGPLAGFLIGVLVFAAIAIEGFAGDAQRLHPQGESAAPKGIAL